MKKYSVPVDLIVSGHALVDFDYGVDGPSQHSIRKYHCRDEPQSRRGIRVFAMSEGSTNSVNT